jgi:hypothetical protein
MLFNDQAVTISTIDNAISGFPIAVINNKS